MLQARDLAKQYGETAALDGFALDIAPGEIVGLIGHNGAGKTTFVEVVTGLVRPDRGSVRICGIDVLREPRAARARIGFAPQELGLYPTATVRENMELFGQMYGLRRRDLRLAIEETAAELVLTEQLDRQVTLLSGGQKRRAQAATALLHRPSLLLLDEPTAGADPATRMALLAAVRARAAAGAAVCYTTHYLPELDELDASIAVAAGGRIIARGDRATLLRDLPSRVTVAYADGTEATVSGENPVRALVEVLASGPTPTAIDLHHPSLDDLYLALAGGTCVH